MKSEISVDKGAVGDGLDSQVNSVYAWLSEVAPDSMTDDFELNQEAISYLHEWIELEKHEKMTSDKLEQTIAREIVEHRAESQRLGKILSFVGLQPCDLSPKATVSLKILTECATHLDVLVPNEVFLTTALSEFSLSLDKKEMRIAERENLQEDLQEGIAEIKVLNNTLQRELSELNEKLNDEMKNAEFLAKRTKVYQAKNMEYQKTIQRLSQEFKSLGFRSEISHEELVKRGDEIKDLQEKLKPLRLYLDSFQNLPADLTKARLKLHEETQNLSELEDTLNNTIINLNG
uniref:AUGMIN subunit 1 isoform X2 n=1 Tax=Ciona intestinalis TaxID=7719 RepID=UPI000521ADB0|nr:AUGMIN subunit 1 isoform X2 [Ciona intestinalis]|eukprot:XP_009861341.1 AUGMIN subunit 1 isoform X2 [Ciona intestinalis]